MDFSGCKYSRRIVLYGFAVGQLLLLPFLKFKTQLLHRTKNPWRSREFRWRRVDDYDDNENYDDDDDDEGSD